MSRVHEAEPILRHLDIIHGKAQVDIEMARAHPPASHPLRLVF
jgi:hypothetical protein